MLAVVTFLRSKIGQYLAGLAGLLVIAGTIFLKGRAAGLQKAAERKDRADAKAQARVEKVEGHLDGNDPDAARRWLSERAKR